MSNSQTGRRTSGMSARRGRGRTFPKVVSQTEIQHSLEEDYERFVLEQQKAVPDFDSVRIASAIVTLANDFGSLKKLDWSSLIDDVLQVAKNCLVFKHNFKSELDGELQNIFSQKQATNKSTLKAQQQRNVETIVSYSYKLLQTILNILSPKDGFSFFVSLMTTTQKSSYGFLNFFENRELISNFRIVPDVNLSNLLKLLMASIRKAKCTLSQGERKVVTYNHVPYTSFSSSAVRFLDELCIFLLNIVQTPVPDLCLDEVLDALINTVAAAPFLSLSLDRQVLQRLVLLVSTPTREEILNSGTPKYLLLSLIVLVLTVEWGPDNVISKISRVEFQTQAMLFSTEVLTKFILDTESNLLSAESTSPGNEIKAAEAAIGVLGSCAEHQFHEFQPAALHCLELVTKIISLGPTFEILWIKSPTKHKEESFKPISSGEASVLQKASTSLVIGSLLFLKNLIKEFGSFLQVENHGDKDWKEETEQFIEYWYNALSKSNLFETTNMDILSTLVDCFSSLTEPLFERLNDKQRVFCIVNILGYSRHSCDQVRSKAARGIALFLEFKCLFEDDAQFLLDCLDTICLNIMQKAPESSGNRLANSRLVFSWAASNLCDALAKHYSETDNPSLGWNVYNKIYELGIRLESDHPKMKYNANRALGALVFWTPSNLLGNPTLEKHVLMIATILASQLGSGNDFKARWNASYALGNIIKKKEVWEKFHDGLAVIIFPAFIRALKVGDNFKERIYCLKALQSIDSQEGYKNYFREIWTYVMESFAANLESKVPVPHGIYENYKEEVSRTIMHLAAMADPPKDFAVSGQLETIFRANYEILLEAHDIILNSNKEDNDSSSIKLGLNNIENFLKLTLNDN